MDNQEISLIETEVKIKIDDPNNFRTKLMGIGAQKVHEGFERDTYFDTQHFSFRPKDLVLRLRQRAGKCIISYKGARTFHPDTYERTEIETIIEDHDKAMQIITRMGFTPVVVGEKYREYYRARECKVVVQKVPFLGYYAEIEGTRQFVRALCDTLGVRDNQKVLKNNSGLFADWLAAHNLNLDPHTFTFDAEKAYHSGRK